MSFPDPLSKDLQDHKSLLFHQVLKVWVNIWQKECLPMPPACYPCQCHDHSLYIGINSIEVSQPIALFGNWNKFQDLSCGGVGDGMQFKNHCYFCIGWMITMQSWPWGWWCQWCVLLWVVILCRQASLVPECAVGRLPLLLWWQANGKPMTWLVCYGTNMPHACVLDPQIVQVQATVAINWSFKIQIGHGFRWVICGDHSALYFGGGLCAPENWW